MTKVKFWATQLFMAVFLVALLGSPALAGKGGNGGSSQCAAGETKVKGQCVPDSTNDGTTTDDGSSSTSDGSAFCPDGTVYLELYGMCIPIS